VLNSGLTNWQRTVLGMVMTGLSDAEIARRTGLLEIEITHALWLICQATGTSDRVELILSTLSERQAKLDRAV
jgi:DNA-binding NarL/FixJ family response regulator